ncbi:TIGR02680 family protein [Sphaerisporangium sp. NPDC049003]|uniref:TIGR02680 family protein n=1 Tax=Sphaerisporangium sp. NPDC049003 TaxID=3364517 RepID=UPI00371D01D1
MTRYAPTRAGIINLWDYRDEEFTFANGWLILRGPNGSGKTKALEVLFPFVLDGRIDPKRLNPFASEDRTMKSNLLFRGQDTAVGYVWLELRHRGTGDAVTLGVGMHAQRHRDTPIRWHFVAEGRVGVDFSLLTADDRPMTRKQLIEELGEQAVVPTASDYRHAIDRRLFGLGRERYEQLITLILTLRRPQLAKNLDPGKLSDTLTDGLRPIDDDLIAEASRSFDDMETVQRTLEGLVAADEATQSFLSSYTTYLRTHARWAADALTRRRAHVTDQRAGLSTAVAAVAAAELAQTEAGQALSAAEDGLAGLRARLEQLKGSAGYQAVEQLGDLERLVRTCEETARAAKAELDRRAAATQKARTVLDAARRVLAELAGAVTRTATDLADEAAAAGIGWGAADAGAEGFADRVGGRVAARNDDVRAVRAAIDTRQKAEQARDLARIALEQAVGAVERAERAEAEAAGRVAAAREEAATLLDSWAERHREVLAELGFDLAPLAAALDQAGEPDAAGLEAVFWGAAAQAVQDLRDTQAGLRGERAAAERELVQVRAERAEIAAERDDAPPPFAARAADRDRRPGAPFWRLVRFADQVGEEEAAAVEAALEAANLLDAWVTPEPAAVEAGDSEGYLAPGPPVTPSLADLLVPEEETLVPAARVTAILRSVALGRDGDGDHRPMISPDGRFAQGVQVGAHRKRHAEYVGATARARRRAGRLAECDDRIAALTETVAELDLRAARAESALEAIAAARAALPRTGPIVSALREHEGAAGRLRATRETADAAQGHYDEAVAACGAAERAVRRIGAERRLDPARADEVAAAVGRFETTASLLIGRRREEARQCDAVEGGTERLEAAADDEAAAELTESAARRRHTEEAAKLDALRQTMGAQASQVLAEIESAETGIAAAARAAESARDTERAALAEHATARARLDAARESLRVAAAEERETARGLAPFAQRELLDVLKCPPGLTWPGQEADWLDDRLPDAVIAVHEAILTMTRDLTPTETSLKQSTTRLTKALDDLQAQLAAAGQDYRPEWDGADGVIVVRIADEDGPLPVGAFAVKMTTARRDQQQLLSESEQRILEDALLTRLAQQIHDRTVDARDLIRRMNTEMRSRRMSSGTTVGVSWQQADHLEDEQRAVCGLLDADAATLGPEQLSRMRTHFATQIKNARARERELPYRELLTKVLDYRRWRQFTFQLVRPGTGDRGTQEERLTRAKHSRLSGGEQSVSLHLPLFAAAHAMLNSARPDAPRLLALDEAFAGVDHNGRSELMSLAAQFDLDLFMTGYDLWATHAAVPAAAHYDLAHSPVEHTVSALLLVWDGVELLADDADDLTSALGSPGVRRVPVG